MKILQINSTCGIGSTGRISVDINNMLQERNHESYIAYGRGVAKECNTSIKIGTKYDNYLHVAITRIFDKHGYGSYNATRKFIKKVNKIDPDIIHLHNIHGYYINIGVLFKYIIESSKPVIWTLHDCWPLTGHCTHFDFIDCNRWKNGCGKCPQKQMYPSTIYVDNSAQNIKRKKDLFTDVKKMVIVTPSVWLAKVVQESMLYKYRTRVINNGIDTEVFKPRKNKLRQRYNIDDKYIILGTASNWTERKGYDYFVNMSKRIEKDEVIILVGLKKDQIQNQPDKIIGVERTDSIEELAEFYSAADVFVNPTLEDNFPTTNLEALACGTPVITFDSGGSGESVDKNCGFVVKQGDIDGLMYSIATVKRRTKMMYAGHTRARAVNLYDKNVMFHEYYSLYKAMLNYT